MNYNSPKTLKKKIPPNMQSDVFDDPMQLTNPTINNLKEKEKAAIK